MARRYNPSSDSISGYTIGIIIWLCLAGVVLYGYVMNIVKLTGMLDGPITAWFIARAVGIIAAPLGVVLGYL